MKSIPRWGSFLLILFSLIFFQDCATLTRRRTQRIPVTSSPAGAAVIVDGVNKGVTPLWIRLARKHKNQAIRIESPGYNPLEIRMKRKFMKRKFPTDIALANVMFGAFCGYHIAIGHKMAHDETVNGGKVLLISLPLAIGFPFLIDMVTGAGYTIIPENLDVTLTKADGSPRIDTIFVDPDEVKNIKWIRVHRDCDLR